MQPIRYMQTCRGNRQPPSVCWVRPEQVVALPSSENKLSTCDLSQLAETIETVEKGMSEARTSSIISLCRRTPLRMFAIVMPIMTTIAPITVFVTNVSK